MGTKQGVVIGLHLVVAAGFVILAIAIIATAVVSDADPNQEPWPVSATMAMVPFAVLILTAAAGVLAGIRQWLVHGRKLILLAVDLSLFGVTLFTIQPDLGVSIQQAAVLAVTAVGGALLVYVRSPLRGAT